MRGPVCRARLARSGFTLIELLVVSAIIGVMMSLLFCAGMRARSASDRLACANNLRQIGLACHEYHGTFGVLPPIRQCPDLKGDLECDSLSHLDDYSGPHEKWWAPYDNRVGPGNEPLGDFDPTTALIWQYVQSERVFHCPEGTDIRPLSITLGKTLQVSYGMNWVTAGPGGRNLAITSGGDGTSAVPLAWDHALLPGCALRNPDAPFGPRVPNPLDDSFTLFHYTPRHVGRFNVVFCDGHVAALQASDLDSKDFFAR
jgi:prepilin-type N-terminal cleavage/methylation domain-containing protein/prepilin-type processing-associated H-X9-DG protein